MRIAIRHTALLLVLASSALAACGREPPPPPAEEPVETIDPILDPANQTATAPDEFRVLMETSEGNVVIAVHRAWAPLGADRFYNLVKVGYYDDHRVYRVVKGFMAQFGMNANPRVTAVWRNFPMADDAVTHTNARGTVSFASSGPNSRTTQIFINYGENTPLDEMGFAPFGEVVEGMDVVERFYAGYGDGPPKGQGPEQPRIHTEGNAYLDASFPQLTKIVRATIETAGGD